MFYSSRLTCGPASFAIGETDLVCIVTGNLLNVGQSLSHIIEISVGGIVEFLALPVGEAVGKTICALAMKTAYTGYRASSHVSDTTLDQWVGSSISELVPAIRSTNSDLGELLLNLLNTLQEFIGRKGATVEGLGANSDSVNHPLATMNGLLQNIEVLLERVVVIGPRVQYTSISRTSSINTVV